MCWEHIRSYLCYTQGLKTCIAVWCHGSNRSTLTHIYHLMERLEYTYDPRGYVVWGVTPWYGLQWQNWPQRRGQTKSNLMILTKDDQILKKASSHTTGIPVPPPGARLGMGGLLERAWLSSLGSCALAGISQNHPTSAHPLPGALSRSSAVQARWKARMRPQACWYLTQ